MRKPSTLIASPASIVTAAALAAALALPATAAAAAGPPPAITVAVHPVAGPTSSYFTVEGRPGATARAGTLEIDSRRRKPVTVSIEPVGALTASTLGSAYGVPHSALSVQASWLALPTRRVVVAPRGHVRLPVSVAVPGGTSAGDYLSGISVLALGQDHQRPLRGNIAIASVQRYAVGTLVKVPGPRRPLIRITSARIAREPAGLTFYLHATNAGNAILQNVRGRLLITRGKRVVARSTIGPGTFVNGTSIDYPLLVPREQPREGAFYRVRAVMRYRGGIARFDNLISFGHKAAQAQQNFGGRPLTDGRSGAPWLLIVAGVLALAAAALIALFLLLRRRRTPGERAAMRALDDALAAAAADGHPLSLVRIVDSSEETPARRLARAVRTRVRQTDGVYRLGSSELLVIMPSTAIDAARLVCSDLQLPLSEAAGRDRVDIKVIEANGMAGPLLIARLRAPRAAPDEIEVSPEMIQRWTSNSKDEQLS